MVSDNIKRIRTENNMTQKDLADKLHVTPQAVSRWETGEVEVSIVTIQEMCKIFNVTLEELVNGKSNEEKLETETKEAVEEVKKDNEEIKEDVAAIKQVVQEIKPVLCLCETCNKPIYNQNDIVRINHAHKGGSSTEIRCRECDERIKKAELAVRVEDGLKQRTKSFVWSSVFTILIALIALWLTLANNLPTGAVIGIECGCLLFFPFFSCLYLDNNFIGDMVGGIISFSFVKFPGLIFDLSLDGFIWLLTVKLAFWIIGFVLGAIAFLFGVALGLVVSLFVYPFALAKNIKHPELSN